jgi:hypothetical protein
MPKQCAGSRNMRSELAIRESSDDLVTWFALAGLPAARCERNFNGRGDSEAFRAT